MDDLEDPNKVLIEGIGKAIEVHLGEEVGFILGCKNACSKKKKKKSHVKLKRGNSNINRVVFF